MELELKRSSRDLRSIYSHRLSKEQIDKLAKDIDPMGLYREEKI